MTHRTACPSVSRSWLGRALVVLGATAALSASASVTWQNIQFGGFLSQGYLDSTNNNYPVETKDGTFDFREYAVNASTTFGNHFRVGAQVFGQKLGKYGGDKPILDWAVADYNFRQEFGIRVGRVKYPRSLHSDVLDADVLRPFIFLPQSMYDARLRDFQASFDGALIYGSVGAGRSTFDYKVYGGDIPMKTDSGVADYFNTLTFFKNPPGVQSIGMKSVRGATLAWNTPISGLRFAGYYSELHHFLVTGPLVSIPGFSGAIELAPVKYTAVSAEYTMDKWTFVAEHLTEYEASIITLPSFVSPPVTGQSGTKSYYVSVARRLTDKLELGTYYTRCAGSYDTAKRNDFTVSGRYDINEHLLFKLEVHSITGTKDVFNVPGIANPASRLKDSMMLFAAKTTLSF